MRGSLDLNQPSSLNSLTSQIPPHLGPLPKGEREILQSRFSLITSKCSFPCEKYNNVPLLPCGEKVGMRGSLDLNQPSSLNSLTSQIPPHPKGEREILQSRFSLITSKCSFPCEKYNGVPLLPCGEKVGMRGSLDLNQPSSLNSLTSQIPPHPKGEREILQPHQLTNGTANATFPARQNWYFVLAIHSADRLFMRHPVVLIDRDKSDSYFQVNP